MIRVIMAQSIGKDSNTISTHKNNIEDRIASSNYDINEYAVNDGTNEDNKPTIGINIKFNSTNDCTTEFNELKNFFNSNSGDFEWVRITVHDCEHNTNGNLPCSLGDVWELN